MRCEFAFVVVYAMLIAAPGVGNAAERSDRIDALRQIATGVGRVIGIASVCREISSPRMKALTDKLADLIKASVTNGEESRLIQQAYDQSTIENERTVTSKQTDCAAAIHELSDLERAVTSQPPIAAATAASPAQVRAPTVAPPPPAGATTGAVLPQGARQRRDR